MRLVFSIFFLLIGFSVLFSCESSNEKEDADDSDMVEFYQFFPDTIPFASNPKVDGDFAFQLDSLTIVVGSDPTADCGQFIVDDTLDGYGTRLYLFNHRKEMVFQSNGAGEHYLFAPFFYKNNGNNQVLVVCQLAFEYFDGGDVFLLDNGRMSYLGNIHVSGSDMETSLIDILKIDQVKNEFIFSFAADSIAMDPGTYEDIISSKGVNYRFANGSLRLNR